MARYQIILAYDGTAFGGMQRQSNAHTVQGAVETALEKIGWPGSSIKAAGRTDAGVHASGQVIAFDFDWGHSPDDLQNALNANLPPDVAAREIKVVGDDFHPRYDALSRTYRYRLFCQPHRNPLVERFAWRVWPAPKLPLLRSSAKLLVGTHDFAAYGTPPKPGGPTVRQVFDAQWTQKTDDRLDFTVTANAYLYHMVRRMVSIQVAVGQGKQPLEVISQSLAAGQRTDQEMLQGLAPAHGLFLEKVAYRYTE